MTLSIQLDIFPVRSQFARQTGKSTNRENGVMRTRIVVVGAGVGGLVAAALLARDGFDVTILERAAVAGGKMRGVVVGDAIVDAGPTVFTLRGIFDEHFAQCGASFEAEVPLRPLAILSSYAWSESERIELFADQERSEDAIGAFAGRREAEGFRRFCERARQTFQALDAPFIRRDRPSLPGLLARSRASDLIRMSRINPFASLWQALDTDFKDQRLRQVFGRFATYCGSSPFDAPSTLMLIADVERQGVWSVEGGMRRLAEALAALARSCGAKLVCGSEVAGIGVDHGRVASVTLAGGERLAADAVVLNAEAAALAAGLFGEAVARAVDPVGPARRSLSAMTWALVAETRGYPLSRHNVFLSRDYQAEFADIFERRRLPAEPTVYVCAQDRHDATGGGPAERLLCIVNAPADGDTHTYDNAEIRRCEATMFGLLERCGLDVTVEPELRSVTTPTDFHRLYPGTGGALYGQASHGWKASFTRPGSRSRIPGLYLAGGGVHPGAGVPMAALSGRMAAASLTADLVSTARSRGMAMPGGMSTRSATTGAIRSRSSPS